MSLEVHHVSFSYARRGPALVDVSLSATTGVIGVLGPNGSGKSTLVRLLATELPLQQGSIRILGQDLRNRATLRSVRRQIGYLPQRFGYYPDFTVFEFVEYVAWLREVPGSERSRAVEEALASVDLLHHARKPLRELSGGQLRRAGLACALVNRPAILLLDEPTVALDPEQRSAFRSLLKQVGTQHLALIATHLVEDVTTVCTKVIVLSAGRVVFQGTPEELAALGQDSELGDTPIERGYHAVLVQLRDHGSQLDGSRDQRPRET